MNKKVLDLINYGISKKTLSLMTESQINSFHMRLLNETGTVKVKKGTSTEDIKGMVNQGMDVEITEKKSAKSKKNPWAICTASLADKFGTSERSEWTKKQKEKYENCVMGVKKTIKEGKNPFEYILEQEMRALVLKHIQPKMSKKDLIETVRKYKLMKEDSPAEPRTKPKPGVKPDTDTDFDPFINPDPDDQPEANSPEPRTKPKPGVKPDTDTDFDPFINPDPDDQPEASSKGLDWFLSMAEKAGLLK